MTDPIDRRSFLEQLAAVAAVAGVSPGVTATAATPPAGTFNGVQMGPHTILDEGIERTLDLLADTAAVNAVMPYSHAYNAGLVKPLRARADHGVPLTDNTGRRFPLVWVRTHEQVPTRTPRFGTRSCPPATSTPGAISSPSLSSPRASAA